MSDVAKIREFVQGMGFIDHKSAAILTGKPEKNCCGTLAGMSDLKKLIIDNKPVFYVPKHVKEKSPLCPHDFYVIEVAALYSKITGKKVKTYNKRNADFTDGEIFFEIDMGQKRQFKGVRQMESQLSNYKDGAVVVFLCKSKYGTDEDRCNKILEYVDIFRKKDSKAIFNVYVIPLLDYIAKKDNQPISRKKNGQIVKGLQI